MNKHRKINKALLKIIVFLLLLSLAAVTINNNILFASENEKDQSAIAITIEKVEKVKEKTKEEEVEVENIESIVVDADKLEDESDKDYDSDEETPSCFSSFIKFFHDLREKMSIKSFNIDISQGIPLLNGNTSLDLGYGLKYRDLEKDSDFNCYNTLGFTKRPRYLRIDKAKLGLKASPSGLLPININIGPDAEFYSFKYFESKKDAAKSLPFKLKNLPITAEKALQMKAGDVVIMPTKLQLMLDGSIPIPLQYVNVNIGGNLFVSGNFQIQVQRLQNDKVRVRLILERKCGAGASVCVTPPTLKVLDLPYVKKMDGAITSALISSGTGPLGSISNGITTGLLRTDLSVKLLQLELEGHKGNAFEFDYIFDLNEKNKDVREAFKQLMSPKNTIKETIKELGRAVKSEITDKDSKKLLSNLSLTQQIVQADESKKRAEGKRIEQLFRSSDKFTGSSAGVQANIILADGAFSGKTESHILTYVTPKDEMEKFMTASHSWQGKGSAIFNVFNESWSQNNMLIIPATSLLGTKDKEALDDNKAIKQQTRIPVALTKSINRSDSNLAKFEWNMFLSHIKRNVSPIVWEQLEKELKALMGSDTTKITETQKNTNLVFQVLLNENAFKYLSKLSCTEIQNKVDEYFKNNPKKKILELGIDFNSDELCDVFSAKTTTEKKVKQFQKLKSSIGYQLIGHGLISSMLPEKDMHKYTHVIVKVKGVSSLEKNKKPFYFEYGDVENTEFFKSMVNIIKSTNAKDVYHIPQDTDISNLATNIPSI
ncbi:MAG: hypothetical protein HQK51_08355 [Oligoflexia bacterium]|nr:hypothetical protein [Oligoflexia bacterium]